MPRIATLTAAQRKERKAEYNKTWKARRRSERDAAKATGGQPATAAPARPDGGAVTFGLRRVVLAERRMIALLDDSGSSIVIRVSDNGLYLSLAPIPQAWLSEGPDSKGVDVSAIRGMVTL